MKKFMMVLLVVLFSFNLQVFGGPGDHFPWGSELPFPWREIQGTWSASIDDVEAYVTFKIIRSDAGYRQLKITIVDPDTCRVLASGAGYEENRVVKAVLASGRLTSKITVHVFRESDMAPDFKHSINGKMTVTIMSVTPMNGSSADKSAFELIKLSADPKPTCL